MTRAFGCAGCLAPRYAGKVLVAHRPEDLQALFRRSAQFEDVLIRYPLPPGRADVLRVRLLRLHQECGCKAGEIALLICLPIVGGWLFWLRATAAGGIPNQSWGLAAAGLLLPVAAAKWITVLVARQRLRAIVRRGIA